ncbi:hypothetical protein FR483_n161R [Paramecium bursaria Chlorella virus FR483]|uniref:Uncharacterized protein n161R n=1 Tax=Paramecium bursaria Chlorella virus FR483 TaxID=399781 RepID=A7J6L5_PBCVF|nr:hypothetical protein FR483_n161R [Paramecium bursaria Chlorella virus FR483]ABT15446.1 hypothetical protein FR483_n161R [Paramecium bursaria Chlorella virus FR483]
MALHHLPTTSIRYRLQGRHLVTDTFLVSLEGTRCSEWTSLERLPLMFRKIEKLQICILPLVVLHRQCYLFRRSVVTAQHLTLSGVLQMMAPIRH